MEATDEGRDEETEDVEYGSRDTPAIDVALTWALTCLELGGAGAGLALSPARSTRVLRFSLFGGGGICVERALVSEADISESLLGDIILLGGRRCEMN